MPLLKIKLPVHEQMAVKECLCDQQTLLLSERIFLDVQHAPVGALEE